MDRGPIDMTNSRNDVPLAGYCDRLSGRPGDTIAFKVSSYGAAPFQARLVRSICADPNPDGPGIQEEEIAAKFAGDYPSRAQPFFPGSYARIEAGDTLAGLTDFNLSALIWPTLPDKPGQGILGFGGLTLGLGPDGLEVRDRVGAVLLSTNTPLKNRHWYRINLHYSAASRDLTLTQKGLEGMDNSVSAILADCNGFDLTGTILFAARLGTSPEQLATGHYNGKLEAAMIYSGDLSTPVMTWDFARGIETTQIDDIGPHKLQGHLVNLPARGMTGSTWTGEEMSWKHAPDHYAAIHFHDDDIYDFGWETDFTFTIPDTLKSGIYAVRLTCEGHEDSIPFFVCPGRDQKRADLCILVSTYTYVIYGNHARPDYDPSWQDRIKTWNAYPNNPAEYRHYGLSTYNDHSDGSGICHASHLRPLFNMRPRYLTFGTGQGSGLRHFQADSHLISWLEAKGLTYDIVTDRELQDEGVAAIEGYRCVSTGTHPEYHTAQTLDALQAYRDGGGNLIYLGGNGFYWRVALHKEAPETLEIRRAESGIRAWAAETGEYYNAFDGTYGGLWRRNGRPPQKLAGVGFSAQGQFTGSYYRKSADLDPSLAWVFEGVDTAVFGDFGLSGGGAAGYELDRADVRLGTPDNAHVLASSEGHDDTFILVPEELLTHLTMLPKDKDKDPIRADMLYCEFPGGGSLFSTGSITFCGSLPHKGFDNPISTLLGNVFRRFMA